MIQGQCFIAIDPGNFADGFTDRLTELIGQCRDVEPLNPDNPVLIPGDPERGHAKLCTELGGIPYSQETFTNANDIAKRLGVEPLKAKTG
uniref:Malate dehydrogenase n=1 Tax=Magallana gigas TaxID=29159 RepID=A0A8W8IQ79_MAGGI